MNNDTRRSLQADPRVGPIDEASIPVLTEKLILPAVELDVSLPAAAPQPAEPQAPLTPGAAPRPEPGANEIAARARDMAIARLQAELGPALEAAVRTRVAAAVDDALLDMLALLQISLESQVRLAVHAAIDEQLAALRTPKPD